MDARSIIVWGTIGTVMVGLLALFLVGFKPEFNSTGINYAILASTLGGLGALFFFFAARTEKISTLVPITALYPIVTIALAYFILQERVTLTEGIGILFALIAMVFFSL